MKVSQFVNFQNMQIDDSNDLSFDIVTPVGTVGDCTISTDLLEHLLSYDDPKQVLRCIKAAAQAKALM